MIFAPNTTTGGFNLYTPRNLQGPVGYYEALPDGTARASSYLFVPGYGTPHHVLDNRFPDSAAARHWLITRAEELLAIPHPADEPARLAIAA